MIIIKLLLEMNNFILLYEIILIRHGITDYRLTVNEIIDKIHVYLVDF